MVDVRSATLLTGGDVSPLRESGTGLFGRVGEVFRDADVSFVNLEGALSTVGEVMRGREFFHRGAPKCVEGLSEAGLSAVNLANNHMLDYGEGSMFETFDTLRNAGIPFFGAGSSLEEARQPLNLEVSGIRVALLGYSTTLPTGYAATDARSGVNPIYTSTVYLQEKNLSQLPGLPPRIVTWTEPESLVRMKDDVERAASDAEVVIVYMHWGTSMTPFVHDFQKELGHAAIDSGAHAVFGGHQHVPSGIEFYRNRPVVHSTGNLLFDKWEPHFTEEARKTFLVHATITPGDVSDLSILPAVCGVGSAPELLSRSHPLWEEVLGDVTKNSTEFTSTFAPDEDRIRVDG